MMRVTCDAEPDDPGGLEAEDEVDDEPDEGA
jgi:hypothetical protein